MKRHLIIIVLAMVGLFLGTNGFPQEKMGPGAGSGKTAEGQRINAFMVDKIIGSPVINGKGEALGKIGDLVVDIDTGQIVYAVLESGGLALVKSSFPSLGNPLQRFRQKAYSFSIDRKSKWPKRLLLTKTSCRTWRICIGGWTFSSITVSPGM